MARRHKLLLSALVAWCLGVLMTNFFLVLAQEMLKIPVFLAIPLGFSAGILFGIFAVKFELV